MEKKFEKNKEDRLRPISSHNRVTSDPALLADRAGLRARHSHATTTTMVSAESPALAVATAGGPAQALKKPNVCAAMPSGHLSDGSSSLTRRSRVKRKNSRHGEDSSSDVLSTSGDISSSQLFVKIPSTDAHSGSSPKSLSALEPTAPPRPPRSPRRLESAPVGEADTNRQRIPRQRTHSVDSSTTRPAIGDIRGRGTRSESGQRWKGQRSRGTSLPGYAFRNSSLSDSSEQPSPLTPNVFNDAPPIPVFASNRRFRHQPRDSGVTQQSTTSSSIYPKSTSTEGSYPYPPSLPAQDMDDCHIITVDPADDSHSDALHEMDADEVSYRLRLLMQNNYYLPPAHSKPFNEIPSPDTPKKSPAKSPSPTFFDLFKVVKKRAATSTDNKAIPIPPPPILRTTSDSSTLSGLLRPQQSSASAQRMRPAFTAPQARQETKGRVVVVRERVDDIATVAKQVEQELKAREAERKRNASEASHSDRIEAQFVDPTDSVDLPLVTASEFFGPQAALLRGMGIDSSLGAALLADQLPPSSPGSWSAESEDVAWRRAILHAAVDHSLNNSTVETPARSANSSSQHQKLDIPSPAAPSMSLPLRSPFNASPAIIPPSLPTRLIDDARSSDIVGHLAPSRSAIIGQRILNCIMDEPDGAAPGVSERRDQAEGHLKRNGADEYELKSNHTLLVTAEPVRASSPTIPTIPLQPPPPRRANLATSGSSSDLAQDNEDKEDGSPLVADADHLQAEEGATLRLSDVYESHVGLTGSFGKLTPPGSQHNSLSAAKAIPVGSSKTTEVLSTTSGSHYSDDEEEPSAFHTPQEHTLALTVVGSRPSLGSLSIPRESYDSSRPSPTASAFRDALDRSHYSANQSDANTLGNNSRITSRASSHSDAFYPVVTPPPRVSSMLAYNAANTRQPHRASSRPRPVPGTSGNPNHSSELEEPGTPTALHVPRLTIQDLLRTGGNAGSYSASPTSFFDAVEMQSHEEEENSSSESDNDEAEHTGPDDTSSSVGGCQSDSAGIVAIDPRTGSTHSLVHDQRHVLGALMQHRNVSSPQLGSRVTTSDQGGTENNAIDRWRAIGNVPRSPARPSFWHKKHGKLHEAFPKPARVSESTADWLKHEEARHATVGTRRPQTASSRMGSSAQMREEQVRQDPSVTRLDGMLVEHMEREREVLKRITTTISKSSS